MFFRLITPDFKGGKIFMPKNDLLYSGFLESVSAYPDRPAVSVAGETLTYAQLYRQAASLAATIASLEASQAPLLTAVFAYRSVTAFAGILGCLMRGHGYVPLNCTFPAGRTKTMLSRSGCRTVIVDSQSENQIDQILSGLDYEVAIILPERDDIRELKARWPMHRFVGSRGLLSPDHWREEETYPDNAAYVLFTSGSTGVPKGVVVTHRNVSHYIDFVAERFAITHEDRFSQMFDMTFDLSVADIFVAWSRGACVCCPSAKSLLNPGRFITEADLTVWFSVPSVPILMKRLGSLKAGAYPRLRVSMFCGEALPAEVANTWGEAAPNSIVENLYGPTELTIACMYYRWNAAKSPSEAEFGIVPIGKPFPGMLPLVVDESLKEVEDGEDGELLMSGAQLSLGYWRDPEKTAGAFVIPPGKEQIYYRTGDRVRKPTDGKPMIYLGRVDNQIKVLGHRVELGEVEAALRDTSGIDAVVAVGWPVNASGASGVEAFIQAESLDTRSLEDKIRQRLPSYMVPRRIHLIDTFPLNSNGKYDRKALMDLLESDNEYV
jgi:amino acid adenylation domain-containing protein